MADTHPYRVFFECPGLDGEKRKRVENYFSIRRRSGGGDCGPVTNVRDNVWSVAFHTRDAQQRVLQKSKHVVEFAGATLVLTLQDSLTGRRQSIDVRPDLNVSLKQSQQSVPAPTLPPSGEEYEKELDSYLLRYLKECPEAREALKRDLASVACSAQLYPEEGRVLVSSLAPNEVRNWKAEADKVFDGYLCHYEADPLKVKALLESCRPGQATDDVKIYTEVGMAVVVGERSQVNAKLMQVEDSRVRRGSRLNERQTTTLRLGKAKLRLLWGDIEQGLGRDFPGVKVTQGNAGQLVLEGPVEEILKAGEWISGKESLVLERKVSDVSPHFLAFLKKAYGGPGMLGDFLGAGDKLEVELRDTELRFFSFSAVKLDDTENTLRANIKDVTIHVPNCSAVPSALQEMLKSRTDEMNKGSCRAQVVFGPDSTVFLQGHTSEVEELSEMVTQFILDQARVEGQVILPIPELAQTLPELLELHKFDFSGVTFHPLVLPSGAVVVLEGPAGRVTQVRNKLGPFLDALVKSRVTIDLPGAVKYFSSPSGKENLASVADAHKSLILLQEQPHASMHDLASGAKFSEGSITVASYSLRDGLQVLVCQGDITMQDADAMVNAANEDLNHSGGVAAALSKAGGPEVQRESKALVKQTGKIPTGDVVVTTGGNLKCKVLLHAVGPVGGKSGGRERALLIKTVQSALNLAETMEFQSIAMPCISSGVFGVPVAVCSEAIVTAVKEFASVGGRSLSKIILIDNRGEVVRAMQEACDQLLARRDSGLPRSVPPQDGARGATGGPPGDGVQLEIIQGTIENQQVDGLVSPMSGHDPLSTRVGHSLYNVVGSQLTARFHKEAGGATLPSDIVLVVRLPGLSSNAVFFLHLLPWDNNPNGTAVQVLRQGIQKILACCDISGFSSVAFPVVGTGSVLRFPHNVVSKVILEEVQAFEQKRSSRSPFLVRVVLHPNDKQSSKAFQSAQGTLHLRGFTNDADPDQATFYRHVSGNNDEVTAMLGGVKLQMVLGDIVHERTDAIINTTDFSRAQSGVSQAILTAAGPTVQAQLAQAGTPTDLMCSTGPGMLGCKEIIHASFKSDPDVIRKNCKKILKQCESQGYQSAAFPAINTGVAGMDSAKACKAMLDGMTSAITDLKPKSLSLIRIVILQQPVFQAFRSELENRFGQTASHQLTLKERAKQKLKKWQDKHSRTSTTSAPQGESLISLKPLPAVMIVITCRPDAIETMKRDLEGMLEKQLVKRKVEVQHFAKLDAMEREAVQTKVKALQISMEYRRSSDGADGSRAGAMARPHARDRSGSRGEVYELRGLKEDVLSIIELVNKAVQEALCEDLQDREEAMLALDVQWSIVDINGTWHELSMHDNYLLEEAHKNKQVFVDITAPDGTSVSVNLRAHQATNKLTGITWEVKRSESKIALDLPKNWEPMQDEIFKRVELQPNSQEYREVAKGFHRTAKNVICKIERVQNLYLWHAFNVCKQRIFAKNGPAELGEKSLYHGTTAEACNCIERDRFDRGYAGTNAARFGKGVYFAVNAQYSANGFCPADASGLKRMYVARVLTGRYTIGNSSMKVAPPRGSDRTDCFDSVVDNQQQPNMFVIFHDDQAYPEYLITFT